jgi:hypothetical protein
VLVTLAFVFYGHWKAGNGIARYREPSAFPVVVKHIAVDADIVEWAGHHPYRPNVRNNPVALLARLGAHDSFSVTSSGYGLMYGRRKEE